ncbi:hypothetical protein ACP70R_009268 [Stipagrostis hirtigluma subsp. patula]
MATSFVVSRSSPVLVGPSTTPAPVGQIKLSFFDKVFAFSPFTSFQVFDRAIYEPAETVRRALSRSLVYYSPIAGRAAIGPDDGELRISCSGEGVLFVAASANCSLEDANLFDRPSVTVLEELAVEYPVDGCRESDPLLLMQVTEFSCGGFVVGTTWNHALADGKGMAQFLQTVGELARGLPRPSVFPVSCGDHSLPELPPLITAIERTMGTLQPQGFVYQDITVPSRAIRRIKEEFAGCSGEPCTVYEAVVAVLWQCRTRAIMSGDPEVPAPLVFAANVREHVGVEDGYYGNCITSAVVVPTSGEVANGNIDDVVKLIKRAKQGIPEQFKNVAAAGEDGGAVLQGVATEDLDVMLGYNAFVVSSWRNLGFDAADFGGGSPARVMCRLELTGVPNCVACLPCNRKDGANVLALCVREEHVDAFSEELAKFM